MTYNRELNETNYKTEIEEEDLLYELDIIEERKREIMKKLDY